MIKNRKGISLTTMVITVMIMLIIMGTLVYSATDSVKIRKVNKLYDDLRRLGDSVEVYYLKNGELPINTEKEKITLNKDDTATDKKLSFVLKSGTDKVVDQNSFVNPNDYVYTSDNSSGEATYEFLKLDLLSNLSLNYPNNEYIINTQSHTIYNYTGLKVGDKTYNSLPLKYKDTKYNEKNQVSNIRLRQIEGVSNSNQVFFSIDNKNVNLRDFLAFDSSENDGLGEPKEVIFTPANNEYYSVNKDGIINVKNENIPNGADNSLNVNVSVTSYGDSPTQNMSFTVYASAIDVCKEDDTIDHINLVKEQTSPTYVYSKTSTGNDYEIKKIGYLNNQNNISYTSVSEDNEIASATYNSKNNNSERLVVFNSGEKTGTTDVTLQAQNYGLAKDTITVNVFDFQIYEGSAGSNINIDKLNFGGTGDNEKTNVKLNFEAPKGFKFDDENNNVEWSIVESDKVTLDDSEIVEITQDDDKTKATIIPLKIGTTNLKCVVTVEGEKMVEIVIPVTVSGIQRVDNQAITNDTIQFSKSGTKTVNLRYVFGDNSITSYSFETPTINPSNGFVIVKNEDNTFSVTYNGNSEVTASLSIIVTVEDEEYKDTINITVSN